MKTTIRLLFIALTALVWGNAQALPDIKHWKTGNGASVLFVEARELPMVDIRFVFDAGGARDDGAMGLARLTNALLDQGAGGLSTDEIAAQIENLGAELSNGSKRDMAWQSLRSLSDPELLEPALGIYAKVLGEPAFPKEDFERSRKNMIVSVQYENQKPDEIAEKAFYGLLYPDHPYGTPPGGDEDSLEALTREQVRDFYKKYYVARNAVIAMIGDLSEVQAREISERLAGGLDEGEHAPALPASPAPEGAVERFISHPSTQSHILVGEPVLARGDPDYYTLYVGNFILGGSGLVSRISEEVREKRGLSYSAYSYFIPMRMAGPYILGLQTRNDQSGEALAVLRDTLRTFRDEGPTEKELIAAKKNITGGFPIGVSSNSKIVEYLAVIGFYGLPLDYLNTFTQRIEAVTLEDIRDAFKRRVDPQRMVTVRVGAELQARKGGEGP
jgi:zinc protease